VISRRSARAATQVEAPAPERAAESPSALDDRIRRLARTLAESKPPKARLSCAQSFCAETARRYWAKQQFRRSRPVRVCPVAVSKLDRESLALAEDAGSHAAGLAPDDASYFIGRIYTAMLPEEYRSELGVYYTPPTVARRLIENAGAAGRLSWETCRALDPACGGGAFLAPIARRMLAAMEGADRRVALRSLSERLRGFEVDPLAAWLSRIFLDVTISQVLGTPPPEDFDVVTVCDSLHQTADASFDLVIGNPPYGRVQLSKKQRERFGRSLYGHANLYALFLDLALQFAKADGLIAYVTPTSFLCGEYFKRLRETFAFHAPPRHLEFISEREGVFDDVLQETLLAVFSGEGSAAPAKVTFAEVGSLVRVGFGGEAPLPPVPSDPWIVARSTETAALAIRLRRMAHRLADWGYSVSTGPLVWNRHKDRLRESKSTRTVPLIWAEAVGADGDFSFRAARRNHSPYFLAHDDEEWLLVRRPCVLLQRTTAKEQARRLIAAELPQGFIDESGGAVTVENHLNMLLPVKGEPSVSTRVLTAFLNSAAADRAFRCISGTVAVSAYELESMPLPAPSSMDKIAELLGGHQGDEELERAFDQLYGPG